MAWDSEHGGMYEARSLWRRATGWVRDLFSPQQLLPEEDLAATPGVDPLLLPRAPMSAENVDNGTLAFLSGMGLRHGKLITAQSHPELIAAWNTICARAGLKQAPQLILAESRTINAFTVSTGEVAVTTGLFKTLTLREVVAVLGHELGHARNEATEYHDRGVAEVGAVGAGLVAGNYVGNVWNRYAKANPGWLLPWKWEPGLLGRAATLGVFGYIGHVVAERTVGRRFEYEADRAGVAISGDPEALISAFAKFDALTMEKPKNFRKSFHDFTSGHPPLAERIHRLREMAPYAPPPVLSAPQGGQPAATVTAERVYYAPQAAAERVH